MSTFSVEGASQIDVEKFLKDAKITKKADIFKTREISIEELIELTREDLESFAKDLGFDALEKNRFIKAISKHKQHQQQQQPVPISTLSTSYIRKSPVIVSSAEHNGITKLYERYDKSSALSTTLQSSILKLNESESNVINQIENIFQTLAINIQNKKKYLLKDIDDMMHRKKELLTKQLSIINNYLNIVQEGKTEYNEYITDSTLTIYKRKSMVLKMINDIMNYDGVSMAMLTSPKMKFDVAKYEKQLNKLCENTMELNDCDEPRPITLSIRKTTFSTITVDFELDKTDIASTKKILEISLEYAILPKSFVIKSPDTKNKNKNKKKKSESKSEDESDTTSTNQSESENESSSNTDDDTESDNDAKLSNFEDIDIDSVKWKENTETIKFSKKHTKRNKYKVEDLKSNRAYIIRMRARNNSGWSQFSKIIIAATKKGFMDSWNPEKKGPYINIERNTMISTNSSWSTVYGKTLCKKGYKYKWRMRITVPTPSSYHMMIGVVDRNRDVTSTHCQTSGCWIFNPYGSGSNVYQDGKSGNNYARSVRTGDIVEMCLDLKRFTLSFSINGTDYGSAIDNLPRDRQYHIAISTSNNGTKVELLKPK